MPIIRIPYGNALPTIQTDYVAQNNLIATGFLQVNKPIWEDAANNIVQGAVFQIGGTVYYANAATAIVGVASDYIKLTPSGDGLTVAPTYVADLTGVTWNSAYNGYYDVGGNAYVFDELAALIAGEIAGVNTRLWKALVTMLTQDVTFSGVPTFSGTNISVNGNIILTGGITENGVTSKTKIINITGWNMNVSVGGTAVISVAHGLTHDNIKSVLVKIDDDDYDDSYPLEYWNNSRAGGTWSLDEPTSSVVLQVITGGHFDNANFNNAGIDRGHIVIEYEV